MHHTFKHTLHSCYLGYITQAINNNLAPILFIVFQNQFNISFEMLGRLILINFGTQLIVDVAALRLVDKIGYRTSMVLAHAFSAAGMMLMGILPHISASPYIGLVIATVTYAIGGGLIEILVNPIVDSLPGEAKASALSLLHSFYCWGHVVVVLLSTVALKLMGNSLWYFLPMIWALIPIYNLIRFIYVPLMPGIAAHEKLPVREMLASKLFIISLVLMLSAGASEQVMAQWASLFAEKGLKVSKIIGDLLGPCLFAVLMGTGRAVYGIWGHRINLKKVLLASSVMCMGCYMVTVFVQIPVVSLLSCALCGLSVSLMWPGVCSLAAEKYPKGGTVMFGMLAIFGDIGCSFGPWLAGAVSDIAKKSDNLIELGIANGLNPDQLGLKSGMLIAILFPIMMFIGVAVFKDYKRKAQDV